MAMRTCRSCDRKSETSQGYYCAVCAQQKTAALKRLVAGEFEPGDDLVINAGMRVGRVNPSGLVLCKLCQQHHRVTDFNRGGQILKKGGFDLPIHQYCRRCHSEHNRKYRERKAATPVAKVIPMPRNRPPGNDAGRQLRDVLDQLSKITPRLESLRAVGSIDAFGDEAERIVLAKHLHRIVATANDLLAALSGMTTDGESNHDRDAELRRIR